MKKNNKYGLHGKLTAQEGKVEELSSILLQAADLMKNADGCHLYMVSVDDSLPNTVWITELWDTETHHEESLSLPGVRELIAKAIPILGEQPSKGQELNVLGGHGVE